MLGHFEGVDRTVQLSIKDYNCIYRFCKELALLCNLEGIVEPLSTIKMSKKKKKKKNKAQFLVFCIR